jgi:hypothetical protein
VGKARLLLAAILLTFAIVATGTVVALALSLLGAWLQSNTGRIFAVRCVGLNY